MKSSSETKDNSGNLIVSTAYLPPVSYVAKCLQATEVIIEQHETYPKQTLRNRCFIYGPNGQQILSIPVIRPDGSRTKTREIRISSALPWQRLHWRSVLTAYSNSPFFLFYQDLFYPAFSKKFDFLLDFNNHLLETVFGCLKNPVRISLTSQFQFPVSEKKEETNFRKKIKQAEDVSLPEYIQVFSAKHGFLSDLSIIDLIFNLGPEADNYLKRI